MTLIWFLLGVAAFWTLAAYRAPGYLWTGTAGAGLALWTVLTRQPAEMLFLTFGLFLLIVFPLNISVLRRLIISNPLLHLFRKKVPHMSQTEREALAAGTVWWDADLFSGRPDWKKLLSVPVPRMTSEEQAFLDGPVVELCQMLDDWRINQEYRDLPPEVWKFIKEKGFFGMIIPKKYGGLEFSALAHSNVIMKIASRSLSASVTVMVPNSLGPAEILLHYGTEEQKDYYLPRLARGQEIPCFALTSLDAGSDAASMTDSGIVCRGDFDGKKDILGIRLTWEKRYITLGPVATVLGLAFKLYDPGHLLGSKEELGITVALIPTQTPGVVIGRRHVPMNLAFQNGPNSGKDVFIPIDWIVGGVKQAGRGWTMLMESLAAGRSISLPALSTGAGKLASRSTGAYAAIRRQFKTPIGHFEGIEEPLARIGGMTYLMDAARVMTLGAVDAGQKPSVISAMLKYHLTELMRRVVNDAMDIQGGSGICFGPRNFMGRVYEAIPISITVEGANILTRSLIIFGQGAIRCHPYILKEMEATADPDIRRASKNFDRAFFGHVKYLLSNAARSFFMGLTGARFSASPVQGAVGWHYKQLTRMSAAFALIADLSMLIMGGALKQREKLSARLGDILSYLYIASAVLKRFEDEGRQKEDLPLVQWSCEYCLHQIRQRLAELLKNFPVISLSWLLRVLIFPDGRPFKAPHDNLGHQIARLLLRPGSTRDRLTKGIFIPKSPDETIGRLESALEKIIAAEGAEQKLQKAVHARILHARNEESMIQEGVKQGIISEDEAALLKTANDSRREAVRVDDFPPDSPLFKSF
ncbi:MAG: acyl-CoA dehydrogenase [Nitrospirae bacterium]|nr:acyl-CoA dehydrogenase [Nitrospirota bacterium]MBI3352036.1 acyl-CoA dehydrogenase [Nitrospirota bacterium]